MDARRESRQPFFAAIELLETESSVKIEARTGDLSLHGCYVDTMNPFPVGSKVRVRITHDEVTFEAMGRVAHAQSNVGMGVFFTEIQPQHAKLIATWLSSESG